MRRPLCLFAVLFAAAVWISVLVCPPRDEIDGRADGKYVTLTGTVEFKEYAIKGSGRKLVVIGGGPEEKKLKALAAGDPNIRFAGRADDETLRSCLQSCRALIFCAEEDFGLAPLEAQACGSPVIAFGRGGATETVIDGKTGVFFNAQETGAVQDAIRRFEELDAAGAFNARDIAAHAQSFSEERFRAEFTAAVERTRREIAE